MPEEVRQEKVLRSPSHQDVEPSLSSGSWHPEPILRVTGQTDLQQCELSL